MKVLATGTSGTICRHLPESVFPINFRDLKVARRQLEKFKDEEVIVIHGAGIVGPSLVSAKPEESHLVNVEKALELARLVLQLEHSKFVFLSSAHVYATSNGNISESGDTKPNNAYAAQKLEAESLLQNLFEQHPSRLLILRIFSILGEKVSDFTLGGAVKKAIIDPSVSIANCDDERDFLAPQQAADLVYRVAILPEASGVVNVGSGLGLSVEMGATILASRLGGVLLPSTFRRGHSTIPRLVSDNAALLRLLGTKRISFEPM